MVESGVWPANPQVPSPFLQRIERNVPGRTVAFGHLIQTRALEHVLNGIKVKQVLDLGMATDSTSIHGHLYVLLSADHAYMFLSLPSTGTQQPVALQAIRRSVVRNLEHRKR